MTDENITTQNQVSDPTVEKDAVEEISDRYTETETLDPKTEKELGKVERATEDLTLGIEDAS
ncbi:MAG: hypothetical protein SAL07_05970 [Oscillatoria sp. PMC 1051.18]|nr:hypothetical protein [Oscillatoria sp. PMC 1050.18]MEC5029440.1 hypothetical protein [Oscillatoria sp. PMC 1051.18]